MYENITMTWQSCFASHTPSWLLYVTFTSTIIIAVVNVIGNCLVCLAVLKDPLKNLQTPFNYFLANLSFSDLLIGCVTLPIFAYSRFNESDEAGWSSSNQYVHTSYFLSTSASTLSLIALIIDRYMAIKWPIYYRLKINMKRSILVSVLIWILSTLLSLGNFVFDYKDYLMIFTNIQMLVTVAVLIFAYVTVYRQLSKQKRRFSLATCDPPLSIKKKSSARIKEALSRKISSATTSTTLTTKVATSSNLKPFNDRATTRRDSTSSYMERQDRVVYAFSLQLIVFLLCAIPSTIMIYILRFCATCSCTLLQVIRDTTLLLVLTISALNPFIVALRLASFQTSLYHIICMYSRRAKNAKHQKEYINSPAIIVTRKYGITDTRIPSNICTPPKTHFYMTSSTSSESLCTVSIKVDLTTSL